MVKTLYQVGLELEIACNRQRQIQNTDKTLYPDIFICLVVLITMPVSKATTERQFSIMRRVKTT